MNQIADIITTVADKNSTSVFDFLTKIIPWILSLMAGGWALLIFRRDRTYKNLDFLIDIDKLLIAEPVLWAIYNDKQNVISNDWDLRRTELDGKLDAYCYLLLNHYEIIYFHADRFFWTAQYWKAWENSLSNIIDNSSRFVKCIEGEIRDQTLSNGFVKMLNKNLQNRSTTAPSLTPLENIYSLVSTQNQNIKPQKYFNDFIKLIFG